MGSKARNLADFVSTGNPLADNVISVSEVDGAAPLANPTFTGTLTYATLNDGTTSLTSTVAELNYVDGVTSNIQTQIDNINTDLVNDTTPQLGGNLDLNSSNITGTGNVSITGSVTATSFSGDGSALTGTGGGLFKGENGEVGSSAGDIFRVNEQTLNTNVTIDADENASATGPLSIASGVTLTVTSGGNLSIV